jgi:DNA-binding transcriptional LysR family regulator
MPLSRQVNLQLLTYLDALVSERHVTRAADRAGIGQPAMSNALARLRVVFRDPILIKTRNGMQPTARALELAGKIHSALDIIDVAARHGMDFDPLETEQHFRIVASDGVALMFLPHLLRHMRQKAPKLTFTYCPGDIRRTTELLRDDDCELVIAHFDAASPDLHQSSLYPQKVVCIASSRHPTIKGRLSLQQFVENRHVVFGADPVPSPGMEAMVNERLAALGLARTAALRVPSITLTPAVVACTDLLAVVPRRIADAGIRTLPLQVLPLPLEVPSIDISFFWHERWHRDPVHSFVRSVLREVGDELRSAAEAAPGGMRPVLVA